MPGTERNFDWGSEADEVPSEEEAAAIESNEAPVQENPAAEVVAEIYEEVAPAPRATKTMNKALERIQKAQDRLDIAACYRLLLDGSLFDVNTPAAQKVDAEIREFVCHRLEVLMGVQSEVSTKMTEQVSPFTETEVKVLKAISKAAEKKILEAQKPKEPEATPAPTLKKVSNEKPVAQTAPVAEPRQQPPPAQQPPVRRQFPQPTPQLRRPGQQQPQKQATVGTGRDTINMALIPEEYRNDPTLKIVDGKAMVHGRNRDGELMYEFNPKTKKQDKPLYKNITLPGRPSPSSTQPIPMPPIEQLMGMNSPVMQAHANGMLGTSERRAKSLGVGNSFAGHLVQTFSNQTSNQTGSTDPEGFES